MPPRRTEPETPGWIAPPAGWSPRVLSGISTRRGGVSQGWLAEANYSLRAGDETERVAENWRRLSAATGIPFERAAGLRLEHGARVHAIETGGERRAGDGLVTAVAGLPLTLTVADCLPLFAAVDGRAAALVHCGWRGIAAGIVGEAVRVLARVSGQAPGRIDAWIGPGIGPCCYTLSSADASRLDPACTRPAGRDDLACVDLPGCVERGLLASGVPGERIRRSELCTACRGDLFYSHRRDRGRTGRMAAWIMLAGR